VVNLGIVRFESKADLAVQQMLSALPSEADITAFSTEVRFGPIPLKKSVLAPVDLG